ncbi:MAG TPA: YbaK/EbsC family protein [Longimicrobium sp.]|nr:YbaK/EbsC family protein [Longimicrobium sp.]
MSLPEPHPEVVRALEAAGVPFTLRRHAGVPGPVRSPADFAAALGYAPERIAKTLLVRCAGGGALALVVAPAPARVDLKAAAARLGCARVELAPRELLAERLGYPPTGVSPFGARGLPVLVDASLLEHPTVVVGGGAAAVEVEVAPGDLVAATGAEALALAR